MFAIIVRDTTGGLDLRLAGKFHTIVEAAAGGRILRIVPMGAEAVEEEQRYRKALERICIPKSTPRTARHQIPRHPISENPSGRVPV